MLEIEDIFFECFVEAFSDKIDPSALRSFGTKKARKLLYEKVTAQIFYKLLKDEKIRLLPGFGSLVVKVRKEKNKKVFNRKSKQMEEKSIKGKKIVYIPGDLIKEFL